MSFIVIEIMNVVVVVVKLRKEHARFTANVRMRTHALLTMCTHAL